MRETYDPETQTTNSSSDNLRINILPHFPMVAEHHDLHNELAERIRTTSSSSTGLPIAERVKRPPSQPVNYSPKPFDLPD
eukprot:2385644-Amphidinium_carterae.1